MSVSLDWVVKGAAMLLTAAGLYYGIATKVDALVEQQRKTDEKLEAVERTVQETYYTLRGMKILP